ISPLQVTKSVTRRETTQRASRAPPLLSSLRECVPMTDAAYEAAVKETFETKPLLPVLMIDDEVPTCADLANGENEANRKKFAQKSRAVALYEAFSKRHMICDV